MPQVFSRALREVMTELGWSARELRARTGLGARTLVRWASRSRPPSVRALKRLVGAVAAVDAAAAHRLLAAAGAAESDVGVALPDIVPVPLAYAVDLVVYAAAERAGLPPARLRPALETAFLRAAELGLSHAVVAAALHVDGDGPAPPALAPAPGAAAPGPAAAP